MKSRTRRFVSGISLAAVAALLVAGGAKLAHASVGPAEQTGTFALLDGTPKIVSKFWAEMGAGLTSTLKVQQFYIGAPAPGHNPTPILNYDVEMQKTMHLIVIRDDFATFAHLHPAFNTGTGTFSQTFTKQPNHKYYVYADSTPHGTGQQVFRFTIESDGPPAVNKPPFAMSLPIAASGPYTVVLQKKTLVADTPQTLDVTIDRGAHPAGDLGSYLGAPSHCVFINIATLEYVHVHPMVRNGNDTNAKGPMQMNMTGVGPLQRMNLPAMPAGTYKLWIQFRGANDKVYTVPFTIAVQ